MRVDRGALVLLTVFGSITWSVHAAVSYDAGHEPWALGALEGRIESQPALTNTIEDRTGRVLARPVFESHPRGGRWVIERPFGRPLADAGLGRGVVLPQGIQGNLAGLMRTGSRSLRPYGDTGGWARVLVGDGTLTAPTMPVVRTTLDADLSGAIYQLLATRSLKASVVVLQASTGEVRALVDYPGPDVNADTVPNAKASLDALHGNNLPASTMKVLSAAYMLERHPADADDEHLCTGDRCWTRHGVVSGLQDAVVRSCNTWFRMESARWDRSDWLQFVVETGLQPADTPGLPVTAMVVAGPRRARMRWEHAVGQQIYVSLVGLASAYATLTGANGHRVNPRVLLNIPSNQAEPRVVTSQTTARIREILWANGRSGTASSVNRNYSARNAGGKTGTGERDGARSDAVFLAVAPWDGPEWVVAVSIKGGGSGSSAASVVGGVLDATVRSARGSDQ